MSHIPIGVESSNRVNLINIRSIAFEVNDVLLNVHGIGIVCFRPTTKCAKSACKYTNIGLVDVDVAVEICMISKSGRSNMVSQLTDFVKVGMLIQSYAIVQTKVDSVGHPLNDVLYCIRPIGHWKEGFAEAFQPIAI